jgi:hypothetical protein
MFIACLSKEAMEFNIAEIFYMIVSVGSVFWFN